MKKEDILCVFGDSDSEPDEKQQLLVRYYSLRNASASFCKPSVAMNSVQTRKSYNAYMKSNNMTRAEAELVDPLKKSFKLIGIVFHENEPFRRPVPLKKDGYVVDNSKISKVWRNSKKISRQIFDCTMFTFAIPEIQRKEAAIRDNTPAIRDALIGLMQTDPYFTDRLTNNDTARRLHSFKTAVLEIIDAAPQNARKNIDPQTRRDLIAEKRKSESPCNICGQPLGSFDDHLHIDTIIPVSQGGTNDIRNLQVVHKSCNLGKSSKFAKKKRSAAKPAAASYSRNWFYSNK